MKLTCFFLIIQILINIANANISIDIHIGNGRDVNITHTDIEVAVLSEDDMKAFKINENILKDALKKHYGKKPKNVYLKSPTPWGDLYKTYKWEQVSRVLSIKSARVIGLTSLHPKAVYGQDFENNSTIPIKVNTGMSQTIENTLTTSWSKDQEISVSQDIEYNVNIIVAKLSGTTSISYTTSWGKSEEKSQSVAIATNSGMETELKPGQAVTALLTANTALVEVEVIYKAVLRGNLAVNFKRELNGHHFWGPRVQDVMKSGGISNEVTTVQRMTLGINVDATLNVVDKVTRLPV